MIKYGELNYAMALFTCRDVHEDIPVDYYRHVIKTAIEMHNDGKHMDINQAAATLLYFAFDDGYLHPSQLTSSGLKALDYAEKFLAETESGSNQLDENFAVSNGN